MPESPPLEATGEHTILGASSVDGKLNDKVVSDGEQRKEYFKGDSNPQEKVAGGTKPAFKAQTLGHKLAEEGRQID